MKKRNHSIFAMAVLLVMTAIGLIGCGKAESIIVSSQQIWFSPEAGTDTITIDANCNWTIKQNDTASWYTITPVFGNKKDPKFITITVKPYDGEYFRSSSFVIVSDHGHIRRTVFVSQNTLEFESMLNKVFGVMNLERWNTDYFGQIIEESYRQYEYDPYDSTTGYFMYFLANGEGVQRDCHSDTVAFYFFTYEYNPSERNLHLKFETLTGEEEIYDVEVLSATDSLYRFIHEFKPNFWERPDMRKVGEYVPDGKNSLLKRRFAKRKKGDPIFITE